MADENTPAFYPRVGQNIAKNFRSAQPPAFIEDPRAMDLPQYGDVDLSVPTQANLEMSRRMAQRQADLKRQQERDRSPLEKVAGALQTGRLMGSALTQAINSMPTRIAKGDKAAEQFMQERMYQPTQPTAYEYAGDIGDFLEKLETDYKIPPVLPEAMALQYLTGPATSQAMRGASRSAEQAGMAIERGMEPVVKGALEQGGLPREMVLGMGANTQSNVVKPRGGNWLNRSVEDELKTLKRGAYDVNPRDAEELGIELSPQDAALNKWIQSNLTNYVKKEMATPEDPVRRLAEQDITHFPIAEDPTFWNRQGESARSQLGGTQMAQSDLAKQWENRSDSMIGRDTAQEFQDMMRQAPGMFDKESDWIKKLPPDTDLYKTRGVGRRFNPQDLGFDHVLDVLREDLTTGRIRPEQLSKVSMEQAVRRTYEYDQELARKMNEARNTARADLPVYKDYPEGYRWIELNKPGSFAAESDAMGHSVRGYEPPKGHPDYVEGSGDSGSSSYGLGGWDAIKSGEAKVYSLVDSKGEPHTTIEVGKGKHPIGFTGDGSNFPYGLTYGDSNNNYLEIPLEKQQEIYELGKKLYFDNPNAYAENRILTGAQAPNLMDTFQKAADMLLGEKPGYIKQIKGKQNRAPKEEYLPYVQDFVKGGDWSDVGDLQNTGFIEQHSLDRKIAKDVLGLNLPRYVTPQEAKDYMILDVNRHHTGAKDLEIPESLLKYKIQPDIPPEGMKRGGKVSISNNPDTMMLELNNQKMKNGVPAYGAGKAVTKQALKAAKPEAMKASEALGKIEGRPLKITQADRTKVGGGYLGGPGFSGLQLTEPEYRAAEAAWAVQNAGTAKTILGGEGDNAVYAAMLGTPTQHQSNQMVFDKLLGDFKKAAKRGELTPELRDLINMRLAAAVDNKGNPVFPANVDIMDKKFRDIADTFSRRSVAGHLMGGVQVGGKKGQIIDYDKIIRSTTDPDLLDQPTGALGNRLFTLSGGIVQRPDLHPAFPTILQGEDLGLTFTPVERNLVMKDFVDKTMREKGRKPGYMDYTRGNPPTQLITEDILTELQKLGKKKGGAVKKAEGGEVTGDDLILEERPL